MTEKQHLNYLRRKTADESELWAADRIEALERQLAARDKQIVMLREAIDRQPYTMDKQVCEALAATEDDLVEMVRKTGSQQSVMDRMLQEIQFLRDHEGGPMDEEVIDILRGNVASLERQRDELKADAVRYRWHPIETAPRDGTEVILWFPHKNIAINGYYGETSDGDWESGYRTWMEWLVADELWFQEDPSQAPSHWMPLPNVPAIDIAITRGEE